MEEKKLTDEEIVKALECCATISVNPYLRGECIDCPYFQKHIDCVEGKRSEMDCIDLIHRLQDENKQLKEEVNDLHEENANVAKNTAYQILQIIELNSLLQYGGYVIYDSTMELIAKKYGVEVE